METSRRRAVAVLVVAWAAVALTSGVASAGHWAKNGWVDRHYNYPPRPSGLTAINNVFGSACNSNSYANSFSWTAADNGTSYRVNYHRKLGGSTSSNLDNDVRGHIGNGHYDTSVKSGIWGYNCRRIENSTKYSVHSWGAAVDINSAYEHYGHCHNHTVVSGVSGAFQNHNWYWGLYFGGSSCDAMHFQYATGY
jgi:hypothetical protein